MVTITMKGEFFMLYEKPYKRRRISFLNLMITLCFVALAARLLYIAHIDGPHFAAAAVNQRRQDMETRNVRARIYDRNMLPLTEAETGLSIAISTEILEQSPHFTAELLRNLDIAQEELTDKVPSAGIRMLPLNTIDSNLISAAERAGTRIISTQRRYSDAGIANHVIGYSPQNDDAAGFGLERAFNDILSGGRERIGIIRDHTYGGFPIANLGQSQNLVAEPGGLRLTLDFHMQQAVESVMDDMIERGAVIVTDVQTGDILAMASRGNFSQNNLAEHLQSADGELLNRAITAFDAGSIFKILTAAAAIEHNLINDDTHFFCSGYIEIEGLRFNCNNRYGHGRINFEQAFAYSCNIPFYRLGIALGFDVINEYSQKFGLDATVLNYENFGEQAGLLSSGQHISNSLLANMSIGQGDTLLTPLQVANMINIVANDGVAISLNLVDAFVDRFGNVQKNFRMNDEQRVIRDSTARQLQQFMASTVTFGTGTRARPENFTAAGKTSSAETGWMENGELKIHAWFAGYTPAENPRFAITVFVQNGRRGATAAAPVFKEVSDRLFAIGR